MIESGKQILVMGAGISGIGAVRLLNRSGHIPVLYDSNNKLTENDLREKLPEDLQCSIRLGEMQEEEKGKVELVIISPGVPVDHPFPEWFRSRNIPVWGEIELAYRYAKGRILAVTGTNGKTTTTALVGKIMKDFYPDVYVVGNIGSPYTEIAVDTTLETVTVAEISSFQLETIDRFHPSVSAVLNITPDHLDRHHTMGTYIEVKESITRNQTKQETCVLNYEDEVTRRFGENCCAEVFYFSSARRLERGIYLEREQIVLADGGKIQNLMDVHESKLLGIHNMENIMAAIAMAYRFGVPLPSIIESVRSFRAVEHRIEYVATKQDVDYYNDSKGTNPDAAIKGIRAMNRPTVLIGGGYDKQSEYDEWITSFEDRVTWLVLLGQTREKIAECARRHGFHNILMAESLEEAVILSTQHARPGDAVLLSPACASWGMFPNFEVRGQKFKELVNSLKE